MKKIFKSINDYKIYANSFPDLDKEEEKTEEKLFQANLKLIPKIIEEFDRKKLPIQKLINVAELGLLRAIKHYIKLKKDDRFSLISLSTWWIRHYIKEAFPSIQFKKKKTRPINWHKATLAIYYAKPPYDTKIAEIKHHGCKLKITALDQTIEEDFKKAIKRIAQDKLEYHFCLEKKTDKGEEIGYYNRSVTKDDTDYLIGLYWAILDSHETINGKYLSPRLLDENGQVIGRFGRRLDR